MEEGIKDQIPLANHNVSTKEKLASGSKEVDMGSDTVSSKLVLVFWFLDAVSFQFVVVG
jgi:hypothetical protein